MTGITWNSAAWDDEDMKGVNGGATEQSRGAAEQRSGAEPLRGGAAERPEQRRCGAAEQRSGGRCW